MIHDLHVSFTCTFTCTFNVYMIYIIYIQNDIHYCMYKFGEGNGNPLQYSCLEIPWTEEPDGLQSIGWQRAGHDLTTTAYI